MPALLYRFRLAALATAFGTVATSGLRAQDPQLFQGDWVGEIRTAGAPTFVRAHFAKDSVGPFVSLDMPTAQSWGVRAALSLNAGNALAFHFPFGRDTAYFEGTNTKTSVDGRVSVAAGAGSLHLIPRLGYDSAFVRSVAGNYALSPDHIISMGPMDEAGGWLSFFDNKTRRGGILYALSDSTFFSGPSYGIDYPITIRAAIRRDARGRIDALSWREIPEAGRGARGGRR